jgi:conserved oligomeric Golgi complex subunit 3
LANRNRRLFSMSTQNALVTLLREGVSVADQSIDSKRDLEDALRTACTDFIEHTCNDFAGNLVKIVEDCKTSPPIKAGMDADSLLDLLTKATERLEVKAGEVISQMALYLDNSATQSILLKPSIRKITKALEEVRKLMSNIPDGEGGWDESKRGKIFMLIDELEQGVKSIGKGSVAS